MVWAPTESADTAYSPVSAENGAGSLREKGGGSAPRDHLWTDEHLKNCPTCYQQYWRGRD